MHSSDDDQDEESEEEDEDEKQGDGEESGDEREFGDDGRDVMEYEGFFCPKHLLTKIAPMEFEEILKGKEALFSSSLVGVGCNGLWVANHTALVLLYHSHMTLSNLPYHIYTNNDSIPSQVNLFFIRCQRKRGHRQTHEAMKILQSMDQEATLENAEELLAMVVADNSGEIGA